MRILVPFRNKQKGLCVSKIALILLLLLLLTTRRSNKPPKANKATHALPPSQSIKSLPLYTLPGGSISFKSFFMTYSHPRRGIPQMSITFITDLSQILDHSLTGFIISNFSRWEFWCRLGINNRDFAHLK